MDPQKGRENRKNCPPSTLASHDTSLMTKKWKHLIENIENITRGTCWDQFNNEFSSTNQVRCQKKNIFLGLCPKLWVGGGHES